MQMRGLLRRLVAVRVKTTNKINWQRKEMRKYSLTNVHCNDARINSNCNTEVTADIHQPKAAGEPGVIYFIY